MQIELNGEPCEIEAETNLNDLVTELSLPRERVAIEINKEVIRRKDWPTTMLSEGDQLEIVHFVGGGSVSRQSATGNNLQVRKGGLPPLLNFGATCGGGKPPFLTCD